MLSVEWQPIPFLLLQCESIVEEFEDDIISLFAKETDHVVEKLCNEVSGTVSDMLWFLTHQASCFSLSA